MKLARGHHYRTTYYNCAWSLNYITSYVWDKWVEMSATLVGMNNKRLLIGNLMTKEFRGWPVSSIILFIFCSDSSRKISLNELICLVNLRALFIVLPKAFSSYSQQFHYTKRFGSDWSQDIGLCFLHWNLL